MLARHGLLPEAELGAAISRPGSAGGFAEARPGESLFGGLQQFQEQNGLTVDGMMTPNGETERALSQAPAIGTDPMPPADTVPPSPAAAPGIPDIPAMLRSALADTSPVPRVLFDLAGPGDPPQTAPARKVPPVPRRKPNRGLPPARFDAFHDPALGGINPEHAEQFAEQISGLPVPPDKLGYYVSPAEFARWGYEVDRQGVTGNARRAFMETFAREGGFTPDKEEDKPAKPGRLRAVAGITKGVLDETREATGIGDEAIQTDLNAEELARVYRVMMRQRHYLGRIGGLAALDQLPNWQVAAALFDTMFMHGSGNGPKAIRSAINAVEPDRVDASGGLTREVFDAYRALSDDSVTRRKLLDELAAARELDRNFDDKAKPRFQYFRFLGSQE